MDADATPGNVDAAAVLLGGKDEIIRRWEQRLRAAVPAAGEESHAILVDTLPAFITHLAQALSPAHPRGTAAEGSTIPQQHGGERVRLTAFRLPDVIREYQLLRDELLEALREAGALGDRERAVVVQSIDAGVREACEAFVLASEAVRERIMVTLAHDLRSPLSAAKAGASLILHRPHDEHVPRWAARIEENVDRVDAMIRGLLDVSRAGSGSRLQLELARCDLVAIARDVLDALRLVHGDRFVLSAPEAIEGYWSAEALGRVLENLASNAVKYGDPRRPVAVTLRQAHDRALLRVHNEGSYIPPEQRGALFDAFSRAARAERAGTQGWGLGLALVRAIAEGHGGSVFVESLPDTGTTFTVDVPVDPRPLQLATAHVVH